MQVDPLERLSISEGTYDCDSDPEGLVEDSIDDELCYATSDIPKLQFRKETSKAQWAEELGMAEVLEKKGKMWITTGTVRDGKIYCSIEETLYLVEIGALDVVNVDGTPLLLSDLYEMVTEGKNKHRSSWEAFEVYRHLKFLGYIVGHHGVPWSVKKLKTKIDGQGSVAEDDNAREEVSEGSNFVTGMFGELHIDGMRPLFDVYLPNSKFKKSAPGNPCFLLCIVSGNPPSQQEINVLEMRYCGQPLKFSTVEHGRVSFFSFNKVELPILP